MTPTVSVLRERFMDLIPRYGDAMRKTNAQVLLRAAAGVVKRVIAITPPGSQGVSGLSARQQGEKRISADLSRLFFPVVIKGFREIPVVFGHRLPTPKKVPTREIYPDVHRIYRQFSGPRNKGVGFRRPSRQRFHVDVRKFDRLLVEKKSHVGRLAAMWIRAGDALKVAVPAWISRHSGTAGIYQARLDGDKPYIEIGGKLPPTLSPQLEQEMRKRLAFAMQYQADAMLRELRHYLAKVGEQAGLKLKTPASPLPPPQP